MRRYVLAVMAQITLLTLRYRGDMSVDVLTARDVPLGGLRAMTVRRSIPQRNRSFISAWCFADHYGPDNVAETGGMNVAPHPHIGLQTVSWLFAGEIEHRDSGGVVGLVRPGEVNLMTGGSGICHSEVSTADTTALHGVQLWVALPREHRNAPRDFQHYAAEAVDLDGGQLRVFIGSLAGQTSPITTFTPLLGAELVVKPRATIIVDLDPTFEHGVLVDGSRAVVNDTEVDRGAIGFTPAGNATLSVTNPDPEPSRVVILGGEPFTEEIVMWWNFVAPDHESIVEAREEWQARTDRFGDVVGYDNAGTWIPAPELPSTRLKPRANPAASATAQR